MSDKAKRKVTIVHANFSDPLPCNNCGVPTHDDEGPMESPWLCPKCHTKLDKDLAERRDVEE